ncbi:hypothetical protein QBC42DRAFT_52782 [Cladorrhinum samala]|uniref:DUF7707 domain-containing protein n=1 Tax=Cladorrhinum samala TaxID=585594 RepID=A0AAV9HWP8_9PEZI|nr:hypothetical protein QBC42DRAFT_52782 [Cladorrhinum samala]
MRHSILLATLSAVTGVVAQSQNFTINPALVPDGTKVDWCSAQFNTCGDLCGGTPTANDCSSSTLSFTCTCRNGTAPGLEYYTGTLPTFICQESYRQCIESNVGDKNAQSKCKTTIQDHCGTLDPSKAEVDSGSSQSTSSSSSASAPAPTGSSGPADTNSPSSTSSEGAAPTAFIANGVAAVAAGVFAAALL